MKTSTIVAVLVVLFVVLGGWYALRLPPMDALFAPAPPQEGVVCTADAMQCPDGTYVGRTGPNCEFVCPAPTAQPAALPAPTGGAEYDPGLGDASAPQQ